MVRVWIAWLFMFVSFHVALAAQADQSCNPDSDACVAIGEWQFQLGLGAGVRTNPVVDNGAIPLVIVPQIRYYGECFFIENLELGLTLHESDRLMFNMIVTPGHDSAFFLRNDVNNFFIDDRSSFVGSGDFTEDGAPPGKLDPDKLHHRRLAALAGLEISGAWGITEWQFQLLQDVSDAHNGQEVRFALGSGFASGKNQFSGALGFTWKSARLVDYYYGVSPSEAPETPFIYRPNSATVPFVRLGWKRRLSEHWRLTGTIQLERLGGAITNSPIVNQDHVVQVFFGALYRF